MFVDFGGISQGLLLSNDSLDMRFDEKEVVTTGNVVSMLSGEVVISGDEI